MDKQYKQAQINSINQKTYQDAKTSGNQTVIQTDDKGRSFQVPTIVAPYLNTSNSGVNWVDASTLQGTAAEKTQIVNAAQQAGLKVITNKNQAADLSNISDANNKLDTIGTILSGIAQPSALSRDLYGIGLTWLATKAQSNPQQAAAGALQSVGLDILKAISGVQGFRGNQTAIQQVTEHLPSIYDTTAVVNQKIDYIKQLMNDRERGLLGTPKATDANLTTTFDNLFQKYGGQ